MEHKDIARYRLATQLISNSSIKASTPEEALSSMGAMQAQDYPAALWAIGLRCNGHTQSDIEKAIADKKIARTWLMRGTLHFAAASDIHWMLRLFSPRLISTAMARDRHLGLSDKSIEKAKALFEKALEGNRQLTRDEMYKVLERGGIPVSNQLGYHMLYRAAWDGVICFGLHDGKQPTFALLDEWIKERNKLSNEQALAALALRYFTSHGPATLKDYVWWSGLKVSDAKFGIDQSSGKLTEEEIDGKKYYMPKKAPKSRDGSNQVHLLPAFDEYIVSYGDRSAILGDPNTQRMLRSGKIAFIHSNGIFLPTVIVDGEVVGTWKRRGIKDAMELSILQFRKLSRDEIIAVKEAAQRYGNFLQMPVTLKL